MFTGLVEIKAPIVELQPQVEGLRLLLDLGPLAAEVQLGASVCVAGCCLTVVSLNGSISSFDLSPETLDKTRFRGVEVGQELNVELSLRAGAQLGGHFVSGHVDGLGRFLSRQAQGDYEVQTFEAPAAVAPLLIPKGSVTIEGVSLTIAELLGGSQFTVALIPETLARTTLAGLQPGDSVQMEGDLLGKYVFAFMERQQATAATSPQG
jgi:riboflavin synthase